MAEVQYRKVSAPDIKIYKDSLYILYDEEPARCLIYPFGVKEVNWKLPWENRVDIISSSVRHGTLFDLAVWVGNGIQLSGEQKIIMYSDKDFARLDYEGTYFGKTFPASYRKVLNWINPNYFVISLNDGTVRWYSTKTGNEKLALFIDKHGKWIFWTPEGYFYTDVVSNSSLIEWRMQNFLTVSVKKSGDLRANYFNRVFLFERIKAIYNGKEDEEIDYSRINTSRNIFLDKYPSTLLSR